MKTDKPDSGGRQEPGCNVSSRFNFTVGGVAIAAALLGAYLLYMFLWK